MSVKDREKLVGALLADRSVAHRPVRPPSGSEAPLSPELISQAHRRLRYRVLPTP